MIDEYKRFVDSLNNTQLFNEAVHSLSMKTAYRSGIYEEIDYVVGVLRSRLLDNGFISLDHDEDDIEYV